MCCCSSFLITDEGQYPKPYRPEALNPQAHRPSLRFMVDGLGLRRFRAWGSGFRALALGFRFGFVSLFNESPKLLGHVAGTPMS